MKKGETSTEHTNIDISTLTSLISWKVKDVEGNEEGLSGVFIGPFHSNEEVETKGEDEKYKHVYFCDMNSPVYRFTCPKLLYQPFESKLHNWLNVVYGAQFRMSGEDGKVYDNPQRIYEAMRNGTKPIGFMQGFYHQLKPFIDILRTLKAEEMIYNVRVTEVDMKENTPTIVGMSRPGTIEENIDIERWIKALQIYAKRVGYEILTKREYLHLKSIRKRKLAEWLNNWKNQEVPDPYMKERTALDLVLEGLLLGHPPEATVAKIIGLHGVC